MVNPNGSNGFHNRFFKLILLVFLTAIIGWSSKSLLQRQKHYIEYKTKNKTEDLKFLLEENPIPQGLTARQQYEYFRSLAEEYHDRDGQRRRTSKTEDL